MKLYTLITLALVAAAFALLGNGSYGWAALTIILAFASITLGRFLESYARYTAWRRSVEILFSFNHYSESLGMKVYGHAKTGKVSEIFIPGWVFGKDQSDNPYPDLKMKPGRATGIIQLYHGNILVFDPITMKSSPEAEQLKRLIKQYRALLVFIPHNLEQGSGLNLKDCFIMEAGVHQIPLRLFQPIRQ